MDKTLRKLMKESFTESLSEAGIPHKIKTIPSLTNHPIEVLCTIGITGDHHGFYHLAGSKQTLKELTHQFSQAFGVRGEFSEGMGPFEKTTLGEIVNQVMGRWCTALSSYSIDCNITPPTIMVGSDLQNTPGKSKVSRPIFVNGSFGHLRMHLELKN